MLPEQWDAIVIGAGQAGPARSAGLAKAGIASESRASLSDWLAGTEGPAVIQGHARFLDANTVSVGERRLSAPRIFLNVGCRPAEPPWAGDAGVQFLTTDAFFDLRELPSDLLIVGGGPVGLELGQALQRLGNNVTIVERAARLLLREADDVAKVIQNSLVDDGVRFLLSADCFHLERGSTGPRLTFFQVGNDAHDPGQTRRGARGNPRLHACSCRRTYRTASRRQFRLRRS